MKKAIIFDLDGTLWDATENLVIPWNEALSKYGEIKIRLTHKDLISFMGKTVEEISEMIIPEIEYEKRIKIVTEGALCGNEYLKTHGGVLYPKLAETLSELKKNYHLSIVSNCLNGYIEAFLNYHNLNQYFDDFECQSTGLTKAENIKLVINRNNIEKAVYVGDTKSDYIAATKAGIPFIHAAYGFGNIEANVKKVNTFCDLKERVREIL